MLQNVERFNQDTFHFSVLKLSFMSGLILSYLFNNPKRNLFFMFNNIISFFSGTSLGSTCKHAIVTCPGGKTTYPVTCSLGCPKDYSIKGSSTVTCQTSGQWSSYATSYCRRNNDPPTQVRTSDEHLISRYNVIVFFSCYECNLNNCV